MAEKKKANDEMMTAPCFPDTCVDDETNEWPKPQLVCLRACLFPVLRAASAKQQTRKRENAETDTHVSCRVMIRVTGVHL